MVQSTVEVLVVEGASPVACGQTQERQAMHAPGQPFSFRLDHKEIRLGSTPISHWWMPRPSLYAQRGRRAVNFRRVVECFWAQCKLEGTTHDKDVQESYLLASLLPYVRSQGARRVFRDSILRRPSGKSGFYRDVEQLQSLLSKSGRDEMRRQEFHSQTAEILGPPRYPDDIANQYARTADELLSPARAVLKDEGERPAIMHMLRRWHQWADGFGRRKGNDAAKQVLDILSYEAKAALHRAYSAVWWNLTPRLVERHQLTSTSAQFLDFWHLEPMQRAGNRDDANFHLLHGHIFGLHPASAVFIQTSAGARLLEDWLCGSDREGSYGRLLHGLCVAMYFYADRHEANSQDRRKKPWSVVDPSAMDEGHTEPQRTEDSEDGDDGVRAD